MSKTNKILLSVIVLLAILNIGLFLSGRLNPSGSSNQSIFTVADTSAIDGIQLQSTESSVTINREGGLWQLNGEFQVDEGLRRLFFSILQRVRVRKPIELVPSDSIHVSLSGDANMEFLVFSNPTKTRTYFFDPKEQQGYEVEIPGYNEYVGGIFELKENQWRDRLVIDENWRSIKSVFLDYQKDSQQDLSITFKGQFFTVEGVNSLDSSKVIDYLNQFQVFEANEILSRERFPKFDSLSQTPPLATLNISSIRSDEPIQLMLFPAIENMAYQLVTNRNNDLMILDAGRVNQILARPTDFQAKE